MYSQILDRETYQQVISLAPKTLLGEYEMVAREIIEALTNPDTGDSYESTQGTVWHVALTTLSRTLPSHPTPNMLGYVLGNLGLLKERRRDGYHVYWNKEQVKLLQDALREEVSNE